MKAKKIAQKVKKSQRRKFLRLWLQALNQSILEKQQMSIEEKAMEQAGHFYEEKLIKKCMTIFVMNHVERHNKL